MATTKVFNYSTGLEAGREDGLKEGREQGALEERARIQAIMALPEAQKLPEIAARLAFDGITVESAQATLKISAAGPGRSTPAQGRGAHYSPEELATAIGARTSPSRTPTAALPVPNQRGALAIENVVAQINTEGAASAKPKQSGAVAVEDIVAQINAEGGGRR